MTHETECPENGLKGAEGQAGDADSQDLGKVLLLLARNAIAKTLEIRHPDDPIHPALKQPGATFVTITEKGVLRGCIGSLSARRQLGEDVRANAVAAAFQDPRFSPLSHEEFSRIRVEVSLLTPARPMQFVSEADVLAQLRPNIDGLIFECHRYRSTFLPQVWESLPEPAEFMGHLKRKAGLAEDFWSSEVKLSRYEVQKWKE